MVTKAFGNLLYHISLIRSHFADDEEEDQARKAPYCSISL
jgi:hypothetical protein